MGERLGVSITVFLEAATAARRIFLLLGALSTLAVVCQHVDHRRASVEHHWNLLLGVSKRQFAHILFIIYFFQIYSYHRALGTWVWMCWLLLRSCLRNLGLLLCFCLDSLLCFRLRTFFFLLCRRWSGLFDFFFLFNNFLIFFLFLCWLLSRLSSL